MKRRRSLVRMFKRQGGKCAICGEQMALARGRKSTATIDHIIPKSLGGNGRHQNTQAACYACNKNKGSEYDGPFLYWMLRDGYGSGRLGKPIGELVRVPRPGRFHRTKPGAML